MLDKDIIISASILSSNFKNLEKEIKSLNLSGINEFHIDIMDGHFVENKKQVDTNRDTRTE